MNTDPEVMKMSSIMPLQEFKQELLGEGQRAVVTSDSKKALEMLRADLRKAGYRTDNKHFKK